MLHENIVGTIGYTPLVKLNKVVGVCKATLVVKLEYFNPGGSIKDRAALSMINEAENDGSLQPGGTIVEASSGNTGYAVAMIGAVRDYKVIVVCSDTIAKEKINALEAFGAKVVFSNSDASPDAPDHFLNTAKRIAKDTKNAIFANQSFNPSNPKGHYLTTGPEIWDQTKGKITTLVSSAGTGGTISGTGKYLKEMNMEIEIVMADPIGSVYKQYFETGQIGEPVPYLVEAAGQNEAFIPTAFDPNVVDKAISVNDEHSFSMARRLAREEGIFCGISSGMIVHAAIQVARTKKKDDLIVAVIPDAGDKYMSRLYSDEWLTQNLPDMETLSKRSSDNE